MLPYIELCRYEGNHRDQSGNYFELHVDQEGDCNER